ncbi:MAG: cell division protein FtsL [Deltaproteobacteria bacterium]|nr:cell division protein FtsL [Deltaproteobacteria bacterium]
MKEISYISYSSTVKSQKRREGIKGFISYLFFLLPMLIVCGIFVTVAVVHLYVRNQVLKYSYIVPAENKKQKMLLDENKALKSQYSVLIAPARIEKYATEKLNMRYPLSDEIIEIKKDVTEKANGFIGQKR